MTRNYGNVWLAEGDKDPSNMVIVVEEVEERKGHGVRPGTLLTWRVQDLDESQKHLTSEQLTQSLAVTTDDGSDRFKVQYYGHLVGRM